MAKFLFLIVFGLFTFSCATHQTRLSTVRQSLISGECDSSIKKIEEILVKADKDRLLYLMELGSALQICKEYDKSNQIFLQADKLSEQVDYTSISKVTEATLLNEEMIQYKGDIFERLFINASAALNFIELQQLDEAMVEVRRINEKYNKFSAEEKNSFELNSFAQYLAGLIYETDRKFDDSCIAYRQAYKLDKTFREVAIDALTSCWRAKRFDEYKELSREISLTAEDEAYTKRKSKNEKVIIFLQGLGPSKVQSHDDRIHAQLLPTQSLVKKIRVSYVNANKNETTLVSQPIYSVTKAAVSTLEADYNSLVGRRVGARIAKEVAADQIRQKNKALGNIALLIMVAAERADLRNWSLLPETIQTIRINPAEGEVLKVSGIDQYETDSGILETIDLSKTKNKKVYLIRSIK